MCKNKILVVTGSVPYPSYSGGAFDVLERIIGLKKMGFTIDLVCTYKTYPNPEDIEHLKTLVDDLKLIKRTNNITDLFYGKPLQVLSRKELKNILFEKTYNYAILESESVGLILKNKTFNAQKIFLRIHNNESKYFYELAQSTKNSFKKIYYLSDSIKYSFYSKRVFSVVDRLWFISKEEINPKQGRNNFLEKSIYLPSPINDPFINQKLDNKNVLFIGSLFMPNNIEALDWYLKNGHNKLAALDKNYKLIIIGGTGDISEDYFVKKFQNFSNVTFHFNVKDLQPFYSQATVFINPMLHGAGVKLKTINAIVNGLLLVSTPVGAEGIGLIRDEMFSEAKTAEEFYLAIKKLFEMDTVDKQKIIKNAQSYLKNNNYINVLKSELQNGH